MKFKYSITNTDSTTLNLHVLTQYDMYFKLFVTDKHFRNKKESKSQPVEHAQPNLP